MKVGATALRSLIVGIAVLAVVAAGAWLLQRTPTAPSDPPPQVDWRRLVESRSEQADMLAALGYVDGTVDDRPERSGVIFHQKGAPSPGHSFYYSRTQKRAQLIDLDGEIVASWAAETPAAWQHVELDPKTGGLLILMKDAGLVALNRKGKERWHLDGRFHHDLAVDDQGRIHALARRARKIPQIHYRLDVLEDLVQVISPRGELIEEWSVLEAIRASPYAFLLPDATDQHGLRGAAQDLDILHTNHISWLDGHLAHLSPLYARGNLLLSVRNINAVMILDGTTHEVLWIWGPSNLVFQHDPVLLENGHLLIFDNGTQRSRVIEMDPATGRILWRHAGPPAFFSDTRGSAQRLENGDTLVTVSNTGYVFELNRAGRRVWEFANPDIDETGLRGAIWRMTRYPPGSLPFLE